MVEEKNQYHKKNLVVGCFCSYSDKRTSESVIDSNKVEETSV